MVIMYVPYEVRYRYYLKVRSIVIAAEDHRLNCQEETRIQTGKPRLWLQILAALMLSNVNVISKSLYFLNRLAKIKLGSNMPTRAERTIRKGDCEVQIMGEPTGEFYDVILYFGIIDILQDYDISKKLEHAYKSFQYDPTSISAVDPKQYSRRFRDFVFRAFQEDKFDL